MKLYVLFFLILNKDFIIFSSYECPNFWNNYGFRRRQKVTLTCEFIDSNPPVNNVTFYHDGQSIPAALVGVVLQIIFPKAIYFKLISNDNIQDYYI